MNEIIKNLEGGGLIEVRIHGRGGQGMVTASFILASALVEEGFFVQAFPEFGPERRGAPVKAYLRFSKKEIFKREPILSPDILIISDESLLKSKDTFDGVKNKTVFIVNSQNPIDNLLQNFLTNPIYFVDAEKIALDITGRRIVNTAMVGAFIKAIGIPSLESVKKIIGRFIQDEERNFEVVKVAFERTIFCKNKSE